MKKVVKKEKEELLHNYIIPEYKDSSAQIYSKLFLILIIIFVLLAINYLDLISLFTAKNKTVSGNVIEPFLTNIDEMQRSLNNVSWTGKNAVNQNENLWQDKSFRLLMISSASFMIIIILFVLIFGRRRKHYLSRYQNSAYENEQLLREYNRLHPGETYKPNKN